jgi:hypothetical protein
MRAFELMVPTYLANPLPRAIPHERETLHLLDPDVSVIACAAAHDGSQPSGWFDCGQPDDRESDDEATGSGAVNGEKSGFGDQGVPVLIHEADGVRIVLGTHDYNDHEKPDVQIERRPNGWAIFLHPLGGSGASGYVYFLDDGRSFLVKEYGLGPTDCIKVLDPGETVSEVDQMK